MRSRAQAASRSPAFSLTPLLASLLAFPLTPPLCLPAATGYDFILIDQQHSAIDPEKIRCLLQAVHAGGSKAMVRVGGCYDRVGIQQAFDSATAGIEVVAVQVPTLRPPSGEGVGQLASSAGAASRRRPNETTSPAAAAA